MTQTRPTGRDDFGPSWPEVPGLGRLPNKRFSDFGRREKFEKRASVATLALLAG